MKKAIEAWVEAHEAQMMEDLAYLVAAPSVSDAKAGKPGAPFGSGCREALDRGLELARRMGYETKDLDGYCGIASVGPKHPSIGIAAHLDVVPVGDGWQTPPFELTQRGDFVIARGCQDNKNAAIMGLYAIKCLQELGVELPCGLQVLMGTSEEIGGMQDMRYFAAHGDVPELSLVADCGYPVCYGQKGHFNATLNAPVEHIRACEGGAAPNVIPGGAWLEVEGLDADRAQSALDGSADVWAEAVQGGTRICARGKSGHASTPAEGDNAVRKLIFALRDAALLGAQDQAAVNALARAMQDDYGTACNLNVSDEVFGELTMIASVFSVKDGCMTLSLDSRFPRAVKGAEVAARVSAFAEANGLTATDISTREAFYIDREDPLVRCLMDVYREETGDMREAFVMGGGTYSHVLPNAITFGPSLPEAGDCIRELLPEGHGGAHQPDEALHVPSFKRSMVIYIQALMRLAPLVAEKKA